MNFVHAREYLHAGDLVVVHCSHRCNVRLMDDLDFSSYQRGASHRYHGGHFVMLPARIVVPRDGFWNVAVDLGGARDVFRCAIDYVKQS